MRQTPCSTHRLLCSFVCRSASNTKPTPMAFLRCEVTYTGVLNVFWNLRQHTSVITNLTQSFFFNCYAQDETITLICKKKLRLKNGHYWHNYQWYQLLFFSDKKTISASWKINHHLCQKIIDTFINLPIRRQYVEEHLMNRSQ